jgi:hypothetical protein
MSAQLSIGLVERFAQARFARVRVHARKSPNLERHTIRAVHP